mmetsp:Transcript_20022/g.33240  ORF Transcript_20022/g.33240 Transcript_20022/m.33240 type:complete len:200 (-) Transcript_20022:88-687(-)|eukprot:CAMPEP_0119011472 /NCGR_PEP_ID=MMETSP1176-20130426/5706_1 /TAXON_ID=265551 /ORGANISM="Synedropsis recta cf, Strain CCMP1620" /LENGTH=199 /DNA_ID=CAMNT_0006964311 /DNA_START=124 /DNA_END=723 /DNA_ORIENTATION=+
MFRLLIIASCLAFASAWVGSAVSGFSGNVCISGAANGACIEMKKGKANVPPQMRGQYAKQQEMQSQRDRMIAASTPGADGLPIFNLYVRSPRANMWYPCGSFKGDDRSKALCQNYADDGLFSGMAKKQLDSGMAGSLSKEIANLAETVIRAYPQLKKCKTELEYGYKVSFDGLPEKQEVTPVKPEEQKGIFDGIKNMFS